LKPDIFDSHSLSTNKPSSSPGNVAGAGECKTVAALVSARAQVAPDALALASENQALTYGDLESQSNRLAHHLLSLGIPSGALVGICLDRSPAMVVAALAILKMGGAYLPLDTGNPAHRLRFMLEDAATPAVIANRQLGERITAGDCKIIDMNKDADQIAHCPQTVPKLATSQENLAYVIYTSGSTGQPKGVQISHGNLLNLISWHRRAFSVAPSDRVSQIASLAFDAAVWEIWPNLAAGSSIHFPDEETRVSAEPLRDWLVQERITISFVPTPLAESLINLDWPPESALRILLTGGDTLHHFPPVGLPFVLVNNYGPTECTVVATSGMVSPNTQAEGLPPIGFPIDNFQICILDEQLQQVPAGTAGELYIGGAGVGRGYLNRADLDAEKFVPNLFSKLPGDRLYRSGDRARYLPDGQIAFLGRIDDQVKIRGYRIEPDEVTAILDRYPGIKSSAVVAREENGDKRLIAYLVAPPAVELTTRELQDFLKGYLPDYMVPATFVRVSSLPLTPSGKIDRASLPAPDSENTISDRVYIAPRNPIEKRIVEILSSLLGAGQVSVNDNFFFLGGHSLLGTQLIARARDSFGVELPLRTVFDCPTAAEISAAIEQMLRKESMSAD
jgi:amino acid adenylation domain-containing protein